MKKQILILSLFLSVTMPNLASNAFEDYEYNPIDYSEESTIENGDKYCMPKKTIKEKLKNAFIGQPTGFTPQIQPSPYLNPNFGPSYMQGYYSGNTWNSHNIYSPMGSARLFGTSF